MYIHELYLREYAEIKLAQLHGEALTQQQTRGKTAWWHTVDARALATKLVWLKSLCSFFWRA